MSKQVTKIFLIGIMGIFAALIFVQTNSNLNESLAQVDSQINSNKTFYSAKDVFVISKPQGYGMYDERSSNVFQPGETMILYIEPVGFVYKNLTDSQGNSLYSMKFSGSATIYNGNGKKLTEPIEIPINELISHYKNKEVILPFTLSQSSPFPPGDYIIKYTISDSNSGNSFDIVKNIVISDQSGGGQHPSTTNNNPNS
jgi:hypothetical protein